MNLGGQYLGPMDHGKFAAPGNRDTYSARHHLVRGEGSGRHLRSIDGNWGFLWAACWDNREGDLHVSPRLSSDIASLSTPTSQGPRNLWHIRGVSAGCAMHHAWNLCIFGRCCRPEVNMNLHTRPKN